MSRRERLSLAHRQSSISPSRLQACRFDIARMADEGRPPLAPLVRLHDIRGDGEVFKVLEI